MNDPVWAALETSGPVASVAVSRGEGVLARRTLLERGRHAARLLPALDGVLAETGAGPGDLTGVVVGTGPGSFTGVRVAAASAKGIAHALGIPLYPVSSLVAAALAERLPEEVFADWPEVGGGSFPADAPSSADRVVLFDARGDRLFCGAFRLRPRGLEVLDPPRFRRLADLLADRSLARAPHCGRGALRHADALRREGRTVLPPPFGLPTADGLLLDMAGPTPPPALIDPYDWEPDYLRDTGAVRRRSP